MHSLAAGHVPDGLLLTVYIVLLTRSVSRVDLTTRRTSQHEYELAYHRIEKQILRYMSP